MKQRWKHFIPAIVSFLIGLFFLAFPTLAVLLVFGLFMGFGVVYAVIVHRFHRLQDEMGRYQNMNRTDSSEPNFRNVTSEVFRIRSWT